MAEQSENTGTSAEQLRAALAEQRAILGQDALLIRENLNLNKKVLRSVRANPRAWMGAAVGTGLFMGLIVPRLASLIGGAIIPKRKPKYVTPNGGKRRNGDVTPDEQEEQSKKAATKGAAMGSLMGGFGSLIIGILRPIIVNMVREKVETGLRSKFGSAKQSQSQR